MYARKSSLGKNTRKIKGGPFQNEIDESRCICNFPICEITKIIKMKIIWRSRKNNTTDRALAVLGGTVNHSKFPIWCNWNAALTSNGSVVNCFPFLAGLRKHMKKRDPLQATAGQAQKLEVRSALASEPVNRVTFVNYGLWRTCWGARTAHWPKTNELHQTRLYSNW